MRDKIDEIKVLFYFYSVLFLCTGIFYNYLYLGHFGIETSKFFTLNDYLASSIDKIIFNLLPLAFIVLSLFLPNEKPTKDVIPAFKISEFLILLLLCTPGIIMLVWFKNPSGFYIFGVNLVGVIVYIISRTFLRGESKYRELLYIMSLLFFISGIWAAAMVARFHVENDDISKARKYSFIFEASEYDNMPIKDKSLFLLAGNSNYFFLYDKIDKITFIVPTNKITAIKLISNRQQTKEKQ